MDDNQGNLPLNPIHAAIAEALDRKIEGARRCRVCGEQTVILQPEVVNLPVSTRPTISFAHNQSCAETVCTNCGNTQLYNLYILGVLDEQGNFNVGR